VSFDSTVTDADGDEPVTYAWDFGDGATSTQADPSHTYTTPGKYVVSLTATDTRGAKATRTTEITVRRKSDTCFSGRSDDFLGNELDTTRWNRNVRVNQALTVAGHTRTLYCSGQAAMQALHRVQRSRSIGLPLDQAASNAPSQPERLVSGLASRDSMATRTTSQVGIW
jgi:PKD repeat protein